MASNTPDAPVPVAEFDYEYSPFERKIIYYRKQLIVVAALAVIGVTGWTGAKLLREHRHNAAAAAYTRAQDVGQLRAVAEEYEGQSAAGNARLEAAQRLAREGKTAEAIVEINQFLTEAPAHPLQDLAKFRLAELQLASGNRAEAERLYAEVAALPGSPFAANAVLRTGDLKWEDGKTDEARRFYEQLLTKHSGNGFFDIGQQRLQQIKQTPPALVEPSPEAAAAPAPGTTGVPALDEAISLPNLLDPASATLGEGASLLNEQDSAPGTSLTEPETPAPAAPEAPANPEPAPAPQPPVETPPASAPAPEPVPAPAPAPETPAAPEPVPVPATPETPPAPAPQ